MQKIEEYIAQRKKKDKLDEFDFKNHSENMAKVIQYIADYFNTYLNLEDYSYEQIKMQQSIDKFKNTIQEKYPKTYEYIISYYWNNKKRLDQYVDKAYNELEDAELFYTQEDFQIVAKYVINNKLNVEMEDELYKNLILMAQEYRESSNDVPLPSNMKGLDNELVDWVKDIYKKYHVNLCNFAEGISYYYFEHYVDIKYDRSTETFYYINRYDYRYKENPFDIKSIYERNKEREFIKEHKGELEMLIMYCYLFNNVEDQDYWPEYVELCISIGRVKLAKSKRILIAVKISGLNYPCEIKCSYQYIETFTGVLKEDPGTNYVLRLIYEKNVDAIWKDNDYLDTIIHNLQKSFKQYAAPSLLEFQSPFKTPGYTEEDFFANYFKLEKGLRRFNNTKIAIINGYMKSSKGKEFLFSNMDDLVHLHNTCKQLKLQLKLAVNFTDSNGKNALKKEMEDTINSLAGMRSFIIAVHLNNIEEWGGYRTLYSNDKRHEHISTMDYPTISIFMQGLATILQDNRLRYFIPDTVKSSEALENLVDILYRTGCSFEKEVNADEE